MIAFVAAVAWGLSHLFSGRAMFLQVGAMIGTIMAWNVYFVIMPSQRKLVEAKERNVAPDPVYGLRGKQRSVHNNYFTLPVLFAMLAVHFPFTYGHADGWLVLVLLMLVGASDPRLLQQPPRLGRTLWWIPVGAAVALAGIAIWLRPALTPATGTTVTIARICPSSSSGAVLPFAASAGDAVHLRADGHRVRHAAGAGGAPAQIKALAVDSTTMPLGNVTHMTAAERRLLGAVDRGGREDG